MTIAIGLTDECTNTQYAPLAALASHYQRTQRLSPLEQVRVPMKTRAFSPPSKLTQVLVSILAGCVTLSEVNPKLSAEPGLAHVWGWPRFADQSSLSRTLDALTLTNIDQLRQSTTAIWRAHSHVRAHDWRGYLWLDFDLAGLPCAAHAEESQKGYFSGKKTPPAVNWHVSAPSTPARPSGPGSTQATARRSNA